MVASVCEPKLGSTLAEGVVAVSDLKPDAEARSRLNGPLITVSRIWRDSRLALRHRRSN